MPEPSQILENLTALANQGIPIAMFWHALTLVALIALGLGWRPRQRYAAMVLALPIISVSAAAFATHDLFNGISFLALATGMVASARFVPRDPVQPGLEWTLMAGLVTVGFGYFYPHFLITDSALSYAYASPLGLLPCPTLSVVIGLAILAGGFHTRSWSMLVGAWGLAYGLFGALVLGVLMDLVLVIGALTLLLSFLKGFRLSHA